MKLFETPAEAQDYDGPGLFLHDHGRRGMLFDRDRTRLQNTITGCGLGLQYVHIQCDGKENQYVDVSRDVLKKLKSKCEGFQVVDVEINASPKLDSDFEHFKVTPGHPQTNVSEGDPVPDLSLEGDLARICRICGCTDIDCSACVEKTGVPCHWVEDDLCSACAPITEPIDDDALITDGDDSGEPDA